MSTKNTGESEPLFIRLEPPTVVVHTESGATLSGVVSVNRPLQAGEFDTVREAVEDLGLRVVPADGRDGREGGRSFGPPRKWKASWQPNPIWGKGNERNN